MTWTATNITVARDNATAPDGTTTADTLTTTNATNSLTQTVTSNLSYVHTFTVFIKPGTSSDVTVSFENSGGTIGIGGDFDLSAETATPNNTGSPFSSEVSIEEAAQGFYKCLVRGVLDDEGGSGDVVAKIEITGASHTVDAWGAHLSDDQERARSSLVWVDNSFNARFAIGTNSGLYIMDRQGAFTDATPIGFTGGSSGANLSTGYGSGAYGRQTYGTARIAYQNALTSAASSWSFAAWGQDLIANFRGGGIYDWSPGDGPAELVANAPSNSQAVVTAYPRILMSGFQRTVSWSDTEDNTQWTPAVTNQAGSQFLDGSGIIVNMVRLRNEVLIVTTEDAWVARYVGPPFVFSFDRVGEKCGCVAANTLVSTERFAAWVGDGQFYVYDGQVQPLACDVIDFVREDLNQSEVSRGVGFTIPGFNEIWWLYQSTDAEENDKYVSWNYRDNFWMVGEIGRACGTDGSVMRATLMIDRYGAVYSHEKEDTVHGNATPFITSNVLEARSGETITHVKRIYPDEEALGSVQATFLCKNLHSSTERTTGPYTLSNPTSTRAYGRQIRMKLEGTQPRWRVGDFRLEVETGGTR